MGPLYVLIRYTLLITFLKISLVSADSCGLLSRKSTWILIITTRLLALQPVGRGVTKSKAWGCKTVEILECLWPSTVSVLANACVPPFRWSGCCAEEVSQRFSAFGAVLKWACLQHGWATNCQFCVPSAQPTGIGIWCLDYMGLNVSAFPHPVLSRVVQSGQ